MLTALLFFSRLNDLVPVFNKVAREHLIANLRSRADGQIVVDMMKEFAISTLQMISLVSGGRGSTVAGGRGNTVIGGWGETITGHFTV